ncbi:fibronectin type III domain-containing protein [Cohnella faecalis]|uniref:fibronectin type III domain-containing protein n=1 Tax=Cohnella faecalis TaxID=2315694 RepID=UPI0011C20ED2|nr:carboxypeptidase regulatory-like domain-containing protein [Cohnella faecalis]
MNEPPAGNDYYNIILGTESRELKPLLLPDGRSPGASSDSIDLSADGKTIAFNSHKSFVPEDTGSSDFDVYWYDWHDPNATKLVWLSGLIENRKYSGTVKVDSSGRYAVFNITLQNNSYMSYVFDSAAPAGTVPEPLMTVPASSPMTLDYITSHSISGDGRYVLFSSQGKNIVPGDTDNVTNLFVRDRLEQKTAMVSLPYDPSIKIMVYSSDGMLSRDGTRFAFRSSMMNMVSGSERSKMGLYVQRIAVTEPSASWPAGSSLTASDIGKTSVKLTWTPAERAAGGYKIFGGPAVIDVPAGATEAVVTGLASDTAYTFTVQAASASGVWTTDGPGAPVHTQAGEGLADLTLTVQGSQVKLVWGDPPAGSGTVSALRILRKLGTGDWQTLATVADAAARSYTDLSAAPGKTYSYVIRGVDGNGQPFPYSVEKTVDIGGFAISSFNYTMPFYFRQHAGQGDKVKLTLLASAGAAAKAELAYLDVNGVNRTLQSALVEAAETGVYKGELAVPEAAAKLLSLKGYIEEDGQTAEAEALREPILVGGTVDVELTGALDLPNDSLLTIYSKSVHAYQSATLKGMRSVTLKGLPAADDYTLTLSGAGGIDLFDDVPVPPVRIVAGGHQLVSAEPLLPARVNVAIYNPSGTAPDVHVIVTDEEGHPLASGITALNGNLSFPAFKKMVGKKAIIRAAPKDPKFASLEQTVTLASGLNRLDLRLTLKTDATLTGTVTDKDGKPVKDATVQVWYQGNYYKAQSDTTGRYTLGVPAGNVYAQAIVAGAFASSAITVATVSGQTKTVDIRYTRQIPSIFEVKLYTETENGSWIGPYELDWREMVHFHITSSASLLGSSNPLLVDAAAGQSVKICANGIEGGYGKACTEVTIGDKLKYEAVLRLSYLNTKAVGQLAETPASVYLYRLDNGANKTYVESRTAYTGSLVLKLPGAGTYELKVNAPGGKTLTRTFIAQEGETVNLGGLSAGESGAFAGRPGNSVLLGTSNPAPGTMLRVSASYSNYLSTSLSGGVLVLDVPADAELVPGSVVWNGQPVTPALADGRYIVSLGTIGSRAIGSLQYLVRVADEPISESLDISPRIRYQSSGKPVEEEIGFARAAVARLTMTAPRRTAYRRFHVTGTAPAGSKAAVYAGDRVVGTAETAPNGRWSTSVEIDGEGHTAVWQLRAEASLGEQRWSSAWSSVQYDENTAEPIEFTLRQPDGRTIRLDPREGEIRFPYVFAPGLPFIATLKFNRPELARDVAFYIGETRVPASLKDGVFQAVINAVSPGAIGIDYSTRESGESIGGTPPPAAEIREQLPPAFRDARQEDLYISPREGGDRKQSMAYTGLLTGAKSDARVRVSAALERTTYAPNANDLALEKETGVPLYGFRMNQSFSDGVLRIELTGYLPADQFSAGLDAQKALALMSAGAQTHSYAELLSGVSGAAKKPAPVKALNAAIGVVAARVGLAFESAAGQNTWKAIDAAYSIYDGREAAIRSRIWNT